MATHWTMKILFSLEWTEHTNITKTTVNQIYAISVICKRSKKTLIITKNKFGCKLQKTNSKWLKLSETQAFI